MNLVGMPPSAELIQDTNSLSPHFAFQILHVMNAAHADSRMSGLYWETIILPNFQF